MDRLFRSEIPLASSEKLHRTHFRWHLLPTSGVLPKSDRPPETDFRPRERAAAVITMVITAPIL